MRKLALGMILLGALVWLLIGGLLLIENVPPAVATPTVLLPTLIALRATDTPSIPTALPLPVPTMTPLVVMQSPTAQSPTAVPPTAALTLTMSAIPATNPAISSGTACAPPDGWTAYTVEPGDTLFGFELGAKGAAKVDDIVRANCLRGKLITVGQRVYLPPGAAVNAPKVDDTTSGGNGGTALPAGLSRTARCPCTITVRAGWRAEQIAAAVDNAPVGFTGRDFMAAIRAPAANSFLSSKAPGASVEGFLFPGTYTLDSAADALQFRDQLLAAFEANITPQMRADASAHGLTLYQAIIMASIVQRESYSAKEQVLIASVFYNRLAANKGLASTVTVQYALGTPANWWPRVVGGQINLKSPYNTNTRLGLPPTPISNPDLSAIRSTIYPAQTDYQYFAAACNAPGNFYTRTWEEFEQGLKCGA